MASPSDGLYVRRQWEASGSAWTMTAMGDGSVATAPSTVSSPIIEVFDSTATGIASPIRQISNVNAGIYVPASGIPVCWGLTSDKNTRLYYLDFASSTPGVPPTGINPYYRVVQFPPGAGGNATPDVVLQMATASPTRYPVGISVNAGLIAVLVVDSSNWSSWIEVYTPFLGGPVTPVRVLNLPSDGTPGNLWYGPVLDSTGGLWVTGGLEGGLVNYYSPGAQGTTFPARQWRPSPGISLTLDEGRGLVHVASLVFGGGIQDQVYNSAIPLSQPVAVFTLGPSGQGHIYWLPQLDQLAFLYSSGTNQVAVFSGYGQAPGPPVGPIEVIWARLERVAPSQLRAGKTVYLEWIFTVPGLWSLMIDPPIPPTITIADPKGAVQVSDTPMVKVDSHGNLLPVGVWSFTYSTSVVGTQGNWTAWVNAADINGTPGGSLKLPAFQLVAP